MAFVLVYGDALSPQRLAFPLLALPMLPLVALRPLPGALAYLLLWTALLHTPAAFPNDVLAPTAVFLFLLGRFLPPWSALALASVLPVAAVVPLGLYQTAVHQLFLLSCSLIPGMLLRHRDLALQREISSAADHLAYTRAVAREMHDLVAYSMSQAALRAQRAAADSTYPAEAQKEFSAIAAAAVDALHELRLVLGPLRRGQRFWPNSSLTHPDALGVDLETAVQAISDDLAASGFSVTFHSTGDSQCSRLQAATLSRVAREMGANILRHGTTYQPVTITLARRPEQVRLVMTNGVSVATSHNLPASGTGIQGMRERLAAIDGTLATLKEGDTWMASATVPLSPSSSTFPETP
ncbi:histidine kinase [Actinomyces sp. 2119]|nr:histidine kinase [Actinomyces sp. 2119]